ADARWLLVDEFQDVSDDQYALISVVAPVGRDDRHLFAVGDERQSIYRFRGAASTKLFTRLKGEYRAQEKGLYQNFRSTEAIVAIANLVQPPDLQSPLEAVGADENRPIHVYEFTTPEDEAERVAQTIQQRIDVGDAPESIAVLYSTHRRADAVEAALGRSKISFYRHIRNSIHDRKEAEPLIALMRDVNVRIRQNELLRTIGLKPAGLVDEIDWIRFDRARASGREAVMTLGLDHRLLTLKDCIDGSSPPHTAHGVPAYGRKLLKAYAPLVDLIDESEWPKLLGNLEYVDRYVDEAAGALRAALDAKNTVVLLAGDSHDAYLAQVLLNEVLPEGDQQHGHFYFCLDCEVPEGFRGFRIDPIDDPTTVISLTLQAWRIAQVLLLREQFDGLSFVALDLETSGKYADRADIIEIGAARFDPETGEIIDRFSSLVQSNHLSGDIAQLTGITAKELHEAPVVHEVLQQFSEWLRPDDIFVGHNIEEFDLAILNRIAVKSSFQPVRATDDRRCS
ncbi:MAG: exonuclease domain-containing protein, partial [Thermomicrobiales bacterium]